MTNPLDVQVGGDHYKKMPIQPMEYSMANKLDACQHTAIKYITRFREKGGVEDLHKAKHVVDMLIAFEEGAYTHQRLANALAEIEGYRVFEREISGQQVDGVDTRSGTDATESAARVNTGNAEMPMKDRLDGLREGAMAALVQAEATIRTDPTLSDKKRKKLLRKAEETKALLVGLDSEAIRLPDTATVDSLTKKVGTPQTDELENIRTLWLQSCGCGKCSMERLSRGMSSDLLLPPAEVDVLRTMMEQLGARGELTYPRVVEAIAQLRNGDYKRTGHIKFSS